MRIHDLEVRTGLERATIRFYEKENLISPQRSENGYRCYTQADAEELLKIKLLRQLGMSLEQIRSLQMGSGDISQVLADQAEILARQIDQKRQSAEVCREIRDAGATYQDLDAAYYLERLCQPPKTTPSWQTPPTPFLEPVPREVHPVRRYVARILDVNILNVCVYFLLFYILRLRPVPIGIGSSFMGWAMWLLLLPVEAVFLHFLGTTPGKWIMGIRLEYFEGGKLRFSQALSRAWRVFDRGMGYQLPGYSLWRLYKSYKEHTQTADMEWDDQTEVHYTPWDGKHKALLVLAVCAVMALSLLISLDSALPPNRAERLTVAEFAENYNFYHTLFYGNTDRTQMLSPNGQKYTDSSAIVHVIIGASQVDEHTEYSFETQDGYIRRITYHCDWTDIFYLSAGSGEHYTAAVTAALSQSGIGYGVLDDFTEKWQETITASDAGAFTYGGITIRWNIETENCRNQYGYYQSIDEELPSSLSLDFEILYN